MNYSEKLKAMQEWAYDNVGSVEEFCVLFDIELADMIKCFPDALVASYNKVFQPDVDYNGDDDEEEAWRGFREVDDF